MLQICFCFIVVIKAIGTCISLVAVDIDISIKLYDVIVIHRYLSVIECTKVCGAFNKKIWTFA